MDPITLLSTASVAYNAIKKGIALGKELQDMGSQLSTWATAISDLEFLESKTKNPPWYKTFSSNVQAEAVEIFAARKKIEAQRAELKQFIQFSYGQSAWEELLRIEAQVRKQRQQTAYKKQELKETIITITVVCLTLLAGIGGLILLAFILMGQQA